jgi:hypothetical protein
VSERLVFDGFSLTLPAGWAEVLEDATFSDPDQPPPVAFSSPGGVGTVYVSAPVLNEDDQLRATAEGAESLALDWGRRRGLPPPLLVGADVGREGARATAVHRVAGEFIQVWVLTDGRDLVEASYVSAWEHQERDRSARDAIVTSIRLG